MFSNVIQFAYSLLISDIPLRFLHSIMHCGNYYIIIYKYSQIGLSIWMLFYYRLTKEIEFISLKLWFRSQRNEGEEKEKEEQCRWTVAEAAGFIFTSAVSTAVKRRRNESLSEQQSKKSKSETTDGSEQRRNEIATRITNIPHSISRIFIRSSRIILPRTFTSTTSKNVLLSMT